MTDRGPAEWAQGERGQGERGQDERTGTGRRSGGRRSTERARNPGRGRFGASVEESRRGGSTDTDPVETGRTIALRQLEVRDRSRRELADTLRRRGVPDSAATEVLASLARVDLVDDARFARTWVDQRRQSRGLARRALAYELARKGVTPEDSGAALAGVDEAGEQALADQVARRRASGLARLPPELALRRLAGHLARKGFPAATAMRAATAALAVEVDGVTETDAVTETARRGPRP